ncbi:MAG: MBL fold metallo-hydrolase [Acidimicrobiales bacterium]
MVELVVLGSGTPVPTPGRGGSAIAVVAEEGWVLVDCGRAATQRAIDAGLDLTAIVAVTITHHHSDHLSDLATLATARWVAGATTPLSVIAPAGPSARFARDCLDPFDDQAFYSQGHAEAGPRPTIDVSAFAPRPEPTPVFATTPWSMSSVLVDHHPVAPAVGYLVEHGVHRVVVSGDTAACDGVRHIARQADVLVHEALLSDRVSPSLLEWNAGARSVGELAAEALPQTLVLTHLIPAPGSAGDERAYVQEVRSGGFAGPTLVAHDLLRLRLGS